MAVHEVLQWLAVGGAIAYLALVIRESIWCWFFGAASSAIYVYLTWQEGLSGQAGLNAFYVAMAGYGFWRWRGGVRNDDDAVPVVCWSLAVHAGALFAIAIGTVLLAHWRSAASGSNLAVADTVADSAITLAALWTTFLVARKELTNWLYWFVIDVATIVLFVRQGLGTAALPFAVYLAMIPFGFLAWWRSYEQQADAR
ncbi:MAG: nicotinamide riboside transporter PnuC [Pseudomonadota bacterium]